MNRRDWLGTCYSCYFDMALPGTVLYDDYNDDDDDDDDSGEDKARQGDPSV